MISHKINDDISTSWIPYLMSLIPCSIGFRCKALQEQVDLLEPFLMFLSGHSSGVSVVLSCGLCLICSVWADGSCQLVLVCVPGSPSRILLCRKHGQCYSFQLSGVLMLRLNGVSGFAVMVLNCYKEYGIRLFPPQKRKKKKYVLCNGH